MGFSNIRFRSEADIRQRGRHVRYRLKAAIDSLEMSEAAISGGLKQNSQINSIAHVLMIVGRAIPIFLAIELQIEVVGNQHENPGNETASYCRACAYYGRGRYYRGCARM
jgi:hypothetical protein